MEPASAAFEGRKKEIIAQLSLPDGSYSDLSPKGSVDEAIRHVLDEINAFEGFVTISSCAGRLSVFIDGTGGEGGGPQAGADADDPSGARNIGSKGGKGHGGRWAYVTHSPPFGWNEVMDWPEGDAEDVSVGDRLIHFKYEPMVSSGNLGNHLEIIYFY